MSENCDAPVIVRRRRKIIRQYRDKTPEPGKLTDGKIKLSDEESSSTTTDQHKKSKIKSTSSSTTSSHKSKILSRRDRGVDKGVGTSTVVRSHSQPRTTEKKNDTAVEILVRQVRRSLSSPRHRQESSDSLRSTSPKHQYHRESAPVREIPKIQHEPNKTDKTNNTLTKLEINLQRFEEERRRFEMEKLKFEKEKRDMDRLRYNIRYEEFERKRNQRKVEEWRKLHNQAAVNPTIINGNNTGNQSNNLRKSSLDSYTTNQDSTDDDNGRIHYTQKTTPKRIPRKPPTTDEYSDDCQQQPKTKPILKKLSTKYKNIVNIIDNDHFDQLNVNEKTRKSSLSKSEDYESSTAESTSSRDADFNDDTSLPEIKIDEDNLENIPHTSEGNQLDPPIKKERIKRSLSRSPDKRVKFASNTLDGKNQQQSLWFWNLFRKDPDKTKNNLKICINDSIADSVMMTTKKTSKVKVTKEILRFLFIETRSVWHSLKADHPKEWEQTQLLRNKCIADLITLSIFLGCGGLIFRFVEGSFENYYKCGVKRVKRDFVDHLWTTSHNLKEIDWKEMAVTKLRKFEEELHVAHEAGMTSYSGIKAWSFINSIIFCTTVVTTIGYGHITPSTKTGRAITIVYAIIGIPMFLILLADFGKLFTRGIKFLWAYVRRLYYTGSLRKVRKQAQVQGVLRGMNMAYEIATFRRPSVMVKQEPDVENASTPQSNLAPPSSIETPTTPMPPEIDIDDEFNLPISLAFIILLAYILCGAAIYTMWEKWTFFEACYFVFISMSTIGFGDLVPQHPIFMMTSIIYLIFGLALTSMCINVVQVKLSDSFRQASAKIGATIGLSLAEEEARNSQNATPVDVASVHSMSMKSVESPTLSLRHRLASSSSGGGIDQTRPAIPSIQLQKSQDSLTSIGSKDTVSISDNRNNVNRFK